MAAKKDEADAIGSEGAGKKSTVNSPEMTARESKDFSKKSISPNLDAKRGKDEEEEDLEEDPEEDDDFDDDDLDDDDLDDDEVEEEEAEDDIEEDFEEEELDEEIEESAVKTPSERRFAPIADRVHSRFTRPGSQRIDYKDVVTLHKLLTPQGKMLSRKRTGISARYQRMIKNAIKRARYMALLPYIG